MTATTRAFPNEPFHGKLAFVYPHVDQETRTVTVRFEVAGKLSPSSDSARRRVVKRRRRSRIVDVRQVASAEALAAAGWDVLTVWDAQADFQPPPPPKLEPLEQVAHALLMTNEFLFVD